MAPISWSAGIRIVTSVTIALYHQGSSSRNLPHARVSIDHRAPSESLAQLFVVHIQSCSEFDNKSTCSLPVTYPVEHGVDLVKVTVAHNDRGDMASFDRGERVKGILSRATSGA